MKTDQNGALCLSQKEDLNHLSRVGSTLYLRKDKLKKHNVSLKGKIKRNPCLDISSETAEHQEQRKILESATKKT